MLYNFLPALIFRFPLTFLFHSYLCWLSLSLLPLTDFPFTSYLCRLYHFPPTFVDLSLSRLPLTDFPFTPYLCRLITFSLQHFIPLRKPGEVGNESIFKNHLKEEAILISRRSSQSIERSRNHLLVSPPTLRSSKRPAPLVFIVCFF